MAESCIFVLAHPGQPRTIKPSHDQLIIQVSISIGAISGNAVRKTSPKIQSSKTKTLYLSRKAFLSSNQSEQHDIISTIIQSLEIPFSMQEDILWGLLDFPSDDQTASRFSNLDEIKSRLSDVAVQCARNSKSGFMDVRIRKVVKLSEENYKKLIDEGGNSNEERQPLDGWIRENMNDVNMHKVTCLGLIHKLCMESPKDNKYFGLKSVRIEDDISGEKECSICLKGLRKDTEAIRMPCSHLFHGYCIFRWILVNPSCPFCRSRVGI